MSTYIKQSSSSLLDLHVDDLVFEHGFSCEERWLIGWYVGSSLRTSNHFYRSMVSAYDHVLHLKLEHPERKYYVFGVNVSIGSHIA